MSFNVTEQVRSSDLVTRYLRDISQFKRLTHDEELELANLIQIGKLAKEQLELNADDENLLASIAAGEKAREKFINANYKLVVSVAKRYIKATTPSLTFLDLIQAGNLGLMRAVDLFDATRGFKFSTYATAWIKQHIIRELEEASLTIRIPTYIHSLLGKIKRLNNSLDRLATAEEIAEHLDVSKNKAELYIQLLTRQYLVSLDKTLNNNEFDAETLLSYIKSESDNPEQADKIAVRDEQLLNILNSRLTDRELFIILNRFGFTDNRKTLEVLGNELGVTRERVRQIEAKALRKLRSPKIKNHIKDLV